MNPTANRRSVLLGGAALATLGSFGLPRMARAATRLDLSEVLPEDNWQTIEIRKFAADVAERTGGEVEIVIHSGGALGFKGPEHLQAVGNGLVPMADLLGAQAAGNAPILKLENLPFLVKSPEELKTLHSFLRPEFDKVATKFNQKFLTTMPSPQNSIFMKEEATSLDALAGTKVRAADMTGKETFDYLGFTGVQIPWGELIPALATGRVDGVGTSSTSAVDGKFWEFMGYIYPTNHIWATNFLSIGLEAWNGLSPEAQEALAAASEEWTPKFWEASKAKGDAANATLVENGMKMVEIPDDMLAEMQERTKPMIAAYAEEVPEAGPIIEDFLAAVGRSA
ncbi:TRAP transporter substrate-binding protein [Salipiger sp.]|uniref:TRAP transporter substrate-binding protein n=1 Tax=Salipiger sp. TaxID=2078585 RepID=UPI003A98611D